MIDPNSLLTAFQTARRDLLALRAPNGSWTGRLSDSALSTATAVSALSVYADAAPDDPRHAACRQLARRGIEWLGRCQNADGGWGDTDKSHSNISTTLLALAAIRLAGMADHYDNQIERAEDYVDAKGSFAGLRRRYGKDKTFAVPILMNCALAGMVAWKEVAALPFEVVCVPHGLLRFFRLPMVSYAIPALVAVGQARYFHRKPLNPFSRLMRGMAVDRSLAAVGTMQPASGGYLEAAPLTSFVVMGLASTGRANHAIVRRGVQFLLASFRESGSWPIDTNLATWNTTLAINALAAATGDVGALGCLDWLLDCQHTDEHPFTRAVPGGWAWTDLSGGVPDVDDTSGALLALSVLRGSTGGGNHQRIDAAAAAGVRWLLEIQNRDGGWPTFCRGWGALPFDRSSADLTAHALRALDAWRGTDARLEGAVARGMVYLERQQRADGSWVPLWFGNQNHPTEENPVYGTARVLLAYRDLGRMADAAAARGLAWLVANQCPDGGWGGNAEVNPLPSSVEETAVALEALLAFEGNGRLAQATESGLQWLLGAVESGMHRQSAPIGLYFARLWYYEKVYPLAFSVAALGRAMRRYLPPSARDEENRVESGEGST
jgi:squalene-hopene/tetraprenyl-beta-curcumene cyclase